MIKKYVVVHSGPDEYGRYVHTRYWMTNYCPGHPDGEYRRRKVGEVFKSPLPVGIPYRKIKKVIVFG